MLQCAPSVNKLRKKIFCFDNFLFLTRRQIIWYLRQSLLVFTNIFLIAASSFTTLFHRSVDQMIQSGCLFLCPPKCKVKSSDFLFPPLSPWVKCLIFGRLCGEFVYKLAVAGPVRQLGWTKSEWHGLPSFCPVQARIAQACPAQAAAQAL